MDLSPTDRALLELLHRIRNSGYQFTTPSPSTHRRVFLRRGRIEAESLEDIFGWNLPFQPENFHHSLIEAMGAAGVLQDSGRLLVSNVRVATVGRLFLLHSAFPPGENAVFLGPDSYRFVDFIRAEIPPLASDATIVDIGAGTGVGGLFAQGFQPQARLFLTDVNPEALRLARVNAAFAGLSPQFAECDGFPTEPARAELVVANPPYLGGSGKTYSDGGGKMGAEISLSWTKQALDRLTPGGGRLLLYTGSAIVRGRDRLRTTLATVAEEARCSFRYYEIDPDVFPGTLRKPAYWAAERIAAVGVVMTKLG